MHVGGYYDNLCSRLQLLHMISFVCAHRTDKAMRAHPELPKIRRCHSYQIHKKFIYKCCNCVYTYCTILWFRIYWIIINIIFVFIESDGIQNQSR